MKKNSLEAAMTPDATVHTAKPQRKRTTQECLEKGSGEKSVDYFRYSWRKMEMTSEDRAG